MSPSPPWSVRELECNYTGVWYCQPRPGFEHRVPVVYKPFVYHWHHIPTDKRGTKTVYCRNERDFIKLIDHWNRMGSGAQVTWVYTPE